MPSILINDNSKVNVKSNIISNGLEITGNNTNVNLNVDYFTENLNPFDTEFGYEKIHIRSGKVKIKSKIINYPIEVCTQPIAQSTPINLDTQLSVEADKVYAIEARGGQINLNINELNALGIENCSITGTINKIINLPNSVNPCVIFGYPTLSDSSIPNLDYHIPFNNNLSVLDVSLYIGEIFSNIEVNQYVVGNINLKGDYIMSLDVFNGSNVNINLNYIELGSKRFEERFISKIGSGYQVYHVIRYNPALGSLKIVDALITNNEGDGELIKLGTNSSKLTLSNCIIKQNSTITSDNVNTRVFATETTARNIYVLGQLVINKTLNANFTARYGTVIVDSTL